jgi:hypothetical protein
MHMGGFPTLELGKMKGIFMGFPRAGDGKPSLLSGMQPWQGKYPSEGMLHCANISSDPRERYPASG